MTKRFCKHCKSFDYRIYDCYHEAAFQNKGVSHISGEAFKVRSTYGCAMNYELNCPHYKRKWYKRWMWWINDAK